MKTRTTVSISQTDGGNFRKCKIALSEGDHFIVTRLKSKDAIKITDLIVPPLAKYGQGSASIPHMLPMDFPLLEQHILTSSGNLHLHQPI